MTYSPRFPSLPLLLAIASLYERLTFFDDPTQRQIVIGNGPRLHRDGQTDLLVGIGIANDLNRNARWQGQKSQGRFDTLSFQINASIYPVLSHWSRQPTHWHGLAKRPKVSVLPNNQEFQTFERPRRTRRPPAFVCELVTRYGLAAIDRHYSYCG
jgi:hypothetical protein